ncbi:anti-phage dCTP deaminase [Microvirga brassicacearum]|uniref:Deoxycytidylate deaminase n=1 Tax=Microvirga brassicacearum TaxID=2580413 RepID=A0A5N3PE15_9HYPH|nr:anti-phage dCTP deaminase [Microvirga brassicacearum]KAB0267954.1 deoxycytidylate deaminase [Microvirga brassicacearum]
MTSKLVEYPELFFCLAGPIGVDLDETAEAIEQKLKLFGYDVENIHITKLIPLLDNKLARKFDTLFDRYDTLITRSNELRREYGDNSIMAMLSILKIREYRYRKHQDSDKALHKTAYIIRQLKRPEEIKLFREIYGKQVFQISIYSDHLVRKERLAGQMREYDSVSTRSSDFDEQASKLLARDEHESAVTSGQRIRDVFPLGDVFIDGSNKKTIDSTIERFIKIIFGYNFCSPSREEYGMYLAKSASLRSTDLSRQVGAAIFDPKGEVKVLGCNEVPSPSGGTYWEDDPGDSREFNVGYDTNEEFKHRLLSDLLRKFSETNIINDAYKNLKSRELIKKIKEDHKIDLEKNLLLMDLIEYGRIIHAEMNAITDAARKGISLQGTNLYCTTFPCHLCAKHIISSGISKVVYIEPYPKSYAVDLYKDEIIIDEIGLTAATRKAKWFGSNHLSESHLIDTGTCSRRLNGKMSMGRHRLGTTRCRDQSSKSRLRFIHKSRRIILPF